MPVLTLVSAPGKAAAPAPGSPTRTDVVRGGVEAPLRSVPQDAREKMTVYGWIMLGFILLAAWILRSRDFHFSTAFMDESIFVLYGRMFLSHRFEAPLDTPLQWSFGWYLWPAMAATADRIGGLIALREMAAGLGVLTILPMFGLARRLFSNAVGLGTALVIAVFAPAVLVSRIATHDVGCIAFFAFGIWAFCRGWKENTKLHWILAAIFLFAAFLCKYLVAVFFPMLVVVAAWKRRKEALLFVAPLSAFCLFYGVYYFHDLTRLLSYQGSYGSLRAPSEQLWRIYFWERWDFWLLFVAALPTLFVKKWRPSAIFLWTGAVIAMLFQWKTKADFDYWKHVNFIVLFLAPAAVAGVISIVDWLRRNASRPMLWRATAVLVLAGAVAGLGKVQSVDRFVFWPNVEPILAYFEGRLAPTDHVLIDDTVLRYYFNPPLHHYQMTDPMYFRYGEKTGEPAYKAAVQDGIFNYIVLDGGIGEEARRLDAAIRPLGQNYQLVFTALDPTRGQKIEVYARQPQPAPTQSGPAVQIASPASNALAASPTGAVVAEGTATGAGSGWYARVDVLTNTWYQQGGDIRIAPDGSFRQPVVLGGQGEQQCYHVLRVRLFDPSGSERARALNYGIARVNPDGSSPACLKAQP